MRASFLTAKGKEMSVREGVRGRPAPGCDVGKVNPKDGELCLNRVKPEETLVEARSGSDVQIDRRIWV
jgi:hypothetical protein